LSRNEIIHKKTEGIVSISVYWF